MNLQKYSEIAKKCIWSQWTTESCNCKTKRKLRSREMLTKGIDWCGGKGTERISCQETDCPGKYIDGVEYNLPFVCVIYRYL